MTAIMFSSLSERRREMAIWRAMGASPLTIVGLLMLEAIFISLLSIILSLVLLFVSLNVLQPWIDYSYGILVNIEMLSLNDVYVFALFIFTSMLISLLPALRAYWFSINDGMTIKI